MASPAAVALVAGLLGLLVGSFLNVVVHRLPIMLERDWRGQCREMLAADGVPVPAEPDTGPYNLVRPRSACPACGAAIPAWHNIPLLSYLWLRGRCPACEARISVRYPLVEVLTAALSALVAWRFGPGLEGIGALLLTWGLIALVFIDLDQQLLPDVITLPLLWLGLALALLTPARAGGASVFADLESGVIGAIAGYMSLWSLYHVFRLLTGKEGLGYGDFKLFAALGAWLGWQMLPLVILLSACVGALTGIALILLRGRDRQLPIPFGPFLAAAGLVAALWGPGLVTAYRGMTGI